MSNIDIPLNFVTMCCAGAIFLVLLHYFTTLTKSTMIVSMVASLVFYYFFATTTQKNEMDRFGKSVLTLTETALKSIDYPSITEIKTKLGLSS